MHSTVCKIKCGIPHFVIKPIYFWILENQV